MHSAVLRSEMAIHVSILVINAFVDMRRSIAEKWGLFQRWQATAHIAPSTSKPPQHASPYQPSAFHTHQHQCR